MVDNSYVGLHADHAGSWIDLRSKAAHALPELAVCVPKDGGSAKIQLVDPKDDSVITLDLVEVAKFLKSAMPA